MPQNDDANTIQHKYIKVNTFATFSHKTQAISETGVKSIMFRGGFMILMPQLHKRKYVVIKRAIGKKLGADSNKVVV